MNRYWWEPNHFKRGSQPSIKKGASSNCIYMPPFKCIDRLKSLRFDGFLQQYGLINFFRSSLYFSHTKIKWYSSSITCLSHHITKSRISLNIIKSTSFYIQTVNRLIYAVFTNKWFYKYNLQHDLNKIVGVKYIYATYI